MLGFEPQISGFGSNRSANCATTTASKISIGSLLIATHCFVLFFHGVSLYYRYKPAVKCIYEYIEEFPVDLGNISYRLFDLMERLPEAEDSAYIVNVEDVDNVVVKNDTSGKFYSTAKFPSACKLSCVGFCWTVQWSSIRTDRSGKGPERYQSEMSGTVPV